MESCVLFGANPFPTLPLSVQFFTNGVVTPLTQRHKEGDLRKECAYKAQLLLYLMTDY